METQTNMIGSGATKELKGGSLLTGSELDSLSSDFLADPYPYYFRLRTTDPVHCSTRGVWILTRYDDVATVLRDLRFGRKGFGEILGTIGTAPNDSGLAASMRFQDPPGYTRLRTLVSKAFTISLVQNLGPHIQHIADNLLDRVWGTHAMDLIVDFAFPLPIYVIANMLGVPSADRDLFRQWSLDIARGLEAVSTSPVFERSAVAHEAISSYFRDLIVERRKRPQVDLLTRLIAAEEERDKLTESELLDVCCLLFVTGYQTTVNLIGNGMLALLRHPIELRRLYGAPGLLLNAIEELLRYDSPVQRVGRMANTDVEIGGKTIPKGAVVLAVLGAANRDPAQFQEPDRLDITRRENRHLAFGSGARFCLGAPLARLEGKIAIGTLLRRLPQLKLIRYPPEWQNSTETRALKELQVAF
jgi:cytochrome P450